MGLELLAGGSAVHGAVYGFDGGGRTVGSAGVALGISIRDQDWARADECGGGPAIGGAEDARDFLHWSLWRRAGTGGSSSESAGGGGESGAAQRDVESAEFLLERGGGGLSISGGGRGEESPDNDLLGSGGRICARGRGGDRGDACVNCGAVSKRCFTEGRARDSVHAECSGYARSAVLSLCWGGERVRRMDRVVCEELGESDAVAGGDESVIFLCGADVGEMGGSAGAAIDR